MHYYKMSNQHSSWMPLPVLFFPNTNEQHVNEKTTCSSFPKLHAFLQPLSFCIHILVETDVAIYICN